jgi:uncharacterized protein (TIGR02001 family)
MNYNHESGFGLGAWVSNVSSNGAEVDMIASYSHTFNDNVSAFVAGTFYHYTKNGTLDTPEINLGASLWMVNVSANYISEYFGVKSNSWYYAASTSFDLLKKENLSLGLALGYTTFDDEVLVGSTNYLDYRISLDRTVSEYTTSLFYTDTDRKTKTATAEADVDDHVFGVAISRSF